jgi:hypothetical protein
MSSDVSIGDGTRLQPHPLRAAILGELHARPFTPIATPSRVLHFAYCTRRIIKTGTLVTFDERAGFSQSTLSKLSDFLLVAAFSERRINLILGDASRRIALLAEILLLGTITHHSRMLVFCNRFSFRLRWI